jgi:hypothetical protein
MRNEQPILLTDDEHLDEIMSARPSYRERLRDLDERILDILYDDQLRQVAHAMAEPQQRSEKRRSHMIAAFALNCVFWLPVIVIAFEVLRP